MSFTAYPDVNLLLERLLAEMHGILGDKLIGLYLYGSLVWGDFDNTVSDVDLLAAIADDLTPEEFLALQQMHLSMVHSLPVWDNRIEIAYLSLDALKTYRTKRSNLGIISPGEPFHIIDAGIDWLMNWYMVRTYGKTLYGPPPETLIDPVSAEEFSESLVEHAKYWRTWGEDVEHRGSQAYAIMTMCRALYTTTHQGEQVSKVKAARWAAEQMPEWAGLIENALYWRSVQTTPDDTIDHAATMDESRRFVQMMIQKVTGE